MNSLIDPGPATSGESSSVPGGDSAGGPPRAFAPLLDATLRAAPEDFRVDERYARPDPADGAPTLDGAGEHLWLHVRKRLANTADVAEALARALGTRPRDVGYAGMKDRRAVTTQWFSAMTTGADVGASTHAGADAGAVVPAGGREGDGEWSVLASARHSRKLRRGAHAGNRFRLVLRDVAWRDGGREAFDARVETLRRGGFPNAFGPQRFGHEGRNLDKARAMFAGAARGRGAGRMTATTRGLLLSAARSAAFNAVLDARVRRGDWTRLLDGEPAMLAGSNAFFVPEPGDAALADRLASGDVSPSGPLPGRSRDAVAGECGAFEADVLAASPALAGLVAGLEAAGVDASRRALVARVPDLRAEREGAADDALVLTFTLAPGVYATSLLAALGNTVEAPA